jgi:hypothetical protein
MADGIELCETVSLDMVDGRVIDFIPLSIEGRS